MREACNSMFSTIHWKIAVLTVVITFLSQILGYQSNGSSNNGICSCGSLDFADSVMIITVRTTIFTAQGLCRSLDTRSNNIRLDNSIVWISFGGEVNSEVHSVFDSFCKSGTHSDHVFRQSRRVNGCKSTIIQGMQSYPSSPSFPAE